MEEPYTHSYKLPINLVHVTYEQTGKSKSTDALGMREMQARAYKARTAQYLLLKAPPASGKSRALMFIALDKLVNQSIRKVIVAVPERSIGNSFAPTELTKQGFYANWEPHQRYNLCAPGSDSSKVKVFVEFLSSEFPFGDHTYYLLLDMQLGGSWVGPVHPEELPVEMEIDWVRFYGFGKRKK